jgi:thiamine pyrophosphokinase
MNRNICIVGAGDFDISTFSPPKDSFIIAADGGYSHLKAAGIKPNLLLGDFDSLKDRPDIEEVLVYPTVKDDTDMGIAAKLGLEKGYRTFYIYGATGGARPEHTLANLQTLCMLSSNGAKALIVTPESTVYTAVTNEEISFKETASGFFSVFCMGNEAYEVSVEGAKYALNDAVLSPFEPLGVSNEFIGSPTRIKVGKGTLIIIWHGSPSDLKSL